MHSYHSTVQGNAAVDSKSSLRILTVVLILLSCFRIVSNLSSTDIHNDFSHYYLGGWMYANSFNPYTEHLDAHCERLGFQADALIPHASHPPLLLLMFSLLSGCSPSVAYTIWAVCQFAILVCFLDVSRRILRLKWGDYSWLVIVAVFCNSTSVQKHFFYSQVQLLVGLICYLAFLASTRKRHVAACGLITLATGLKLYPLVLLPWFLWEGRTAGARRYLVVLAVGLACLILPGIRTWYDFACLGIPNLAEHSVRWTNLSIQSLLQLLSQTPSMVVESAGSPATNFTASCASLILIALAYLAIVLKRPESRVAFGVLLSTATVAGVIAWSHYFTLLLLPVALLWGRAMSMKSPLVRILGCVAGVLVIMPQLDSVFFFGAPTSVSRVLLQFYPLLSTFIVCVLLLNVLPSKPAEC